MIVERSDKRDCSIKRGSYMILGEIQVSEISMEEMGGKWNYSEKE